MRDDGCPYCGSIYYNSQLDSDNTTEIYYICKCRDCKKEFKLLESYELVERYFYDMSGDEIL